MSAQFNFRKLWQMKFFLSFIFFPVEVLLLHRILAVNRNLFQVCFFQILTLLHLLQNLNNCVHLFFGIHFCTAPQNSVFVKRKSSKDSFFLKCLQVLLRPEHRIQLRIHGKILLCSRSDIQLLQVLLKDNVLLKLKVFLLS